MKKYFLLSFVFLFSIFFIFEKKENNFEKNTKNINYSEKISKITFEEKEPKREIFEEKNFERKFDIFEEKKDFKKYLPVFMFHYIKNIPANSSDKYAYNLSFSPEKLEKFLIYFKENNIETLTFWDLKKIIENKKEFPKKAVILSFDDWHLDQYENAFKILQKHKMKWVFFIISDKPNNDKNYATREQIKEISDNWHEIGSHSVSHLNLASLNEEKIKYQIENSKKRIEEKIGKPIISFCYPSWKYNKKVLEIVEKNYLFARTTKAWKIFDFWKRFEINTVRIFPLTWFKSLKIWFSDEKFK